MDPTPLEEGRGPTFGSEGYYEEKEMDSDVHVQRPTRRRGSLKVDQSLVTQESIDSARMSIRNTRLAEARAQSVKCNLPCFDEEDDGQYFFLGSTQCRPNIRTPTNFFFATDAQASRRSVATSCVPWTTATST